MAGGRPTTYTKEMLIKAHEYVDIYETVDDKIPSIVGLCKYIERSKTCVYDWAKEEGKEEFSDILAKIQETQQQVLINKGLSGDFNSNITKLVLGKHGYHERKELSGPEGKPMQVIATEMTAEQASKIYDDIIS